MPTNTAIRHELVSRNMVLNYPWLLADVRENVSRGTGFGQSSPSVAFVPYSYEGIVEGMASTLLVTC